MRRVEDGKAVWSQNLRDEFDAVDERKWGMCASPLIADGKLIVHPGGKDAAIAALDPKNGKPVWKTPGKPSGYGSFIAVKFGGMLQVVGYDTESLGGWDTKTGKRLWTLKPERGGDFNVPTPIVVGDKLLVTTENNGTRHIRLQSRRYDRLQAGGDTQEARAGHAYPVVAEDRLFGVWNRLYCLSLKDNLKELYDEAGTAFSGYCAAVATDKRVLVVSKSGELILLDATVKEYTELGRLAVFGKDENGVYAHPAFVGTRVYVRGSRAVACLELGG